ncbi:hypothetical protein PVA38_10060 [Streptococcus pneumoniae D39]|nr:hypothetical protein PVA38_10060 [Streptococcus pneumoniae D39]
MYLFYEFFPLFSKSFCCCLLYTSDAADEARSVVLVSVRIIKLNKNNSIRRYSSRCCN